MKRTLLVACFALALTSSLHADVTIKAIGGGKGLGMSASMPTVTYIKGMKMRTDTVSGDKTLTTIFDVEQQKMYLFVSKKKEADVWDMAAFAGEMSKTVTVDGVTSSITPNGQTKQVAGKTVDGYDVEISVPASVGGSGGMKMNATLTGQVWIAKGAPGSADYSGFYKAAAEKGFIFTDPRAAKGAPGQVKAMAEMYEEFAKLGGVPYASEMDIKLSGDGPMAGLMARMGGMSMTSTTESVDTAAIPDHMFMPPAGYKLNQKK